MVAMEARPFRPVARALCGACAIGLLALAAAWALKGPGRPPQPAGLNGQVDRALALSLEALLAAQGSDGSWRSHTYGGMKDGLSLTPPILKALAFGATGADAEAARVRGARYLIGRVRQDGSIDGGPFGLGYPIYTSAIAAIVLTRIRVEGSQAALEAYLRELRSRQLAEPLGWSAADLAYGAWGDSARPSARIEVRLGALPPADADLSSTLFAVSALRMAGAGPDDPAIRKALAFLERCQNFPARDEDRDPIHDDGGFVFSPTDVMRNKAGCAGTDRHGRMRYHSYGSATADGLRALLRCGVPAQSPRVQAALAWLERHASIATNPGSYEPGREVERDATYYYYAWSLAHACRALEEQGVSTRGGRLAGWPERLARELMRRQRHEGTWVNPYSAAKEDDPLVATTLAGGALGVCAMMLERERPGTGSPSRPAGSAAKDPVGARER